jgi:hypothetical protein
MAWLFKEERRRAGMRAEMENSRNDQQTRPAEQPWQTAAASGLFLLLCFLWRLLSIEKGRLLLMWGGRLSIALAGFERRRR